MESFPSTSKYTDVNLKDKFISDSLILCFERLKNENYIQSDLSENSSDSTIMFAQELAEKIISMIEKYDFCEQDELYVEDEPSTFYVETNKNIDQFTDEMVCNKNGMYE